MTGNGNGNRTFVIGVGMTKFEKPGAQDWDYPDMAREAGTKALEDAGIAYDEVEQAFVGYCYGESTSGQRAVYGLGLTGIPVVNVNNNCSTGSTALYMARQAVEGGLADCALALGFEKMEKGSLGVKYTDRTNPIDKHVDDDVRGARAGAVAAGAADVRQRRPRAHGALRLRARPLRLDRLEEPQALGQQPVRAVPGRVLARGHQGREDDPRAADQAAVLADLRRLRRARSSRSERFVDEHDLWDQAVEIAGQAMVTDMPVDVRGAQLDQDRRLRHVEGRPPSRPTRRPGVGPEDVDVIELHDCFSRQRADHLRGARPGRGGRGPQARRGRGHDLRRALGGQPVRRPDLEGPPARRDRPRAVLRAHLAAARRRPTSARSRAPRSASSTTSASAAPPWSRSTSRPRTAAREEHRQWRRNNVHCTARSSRSPAGPGASAGRRRRPLVRRGCRVALGDIDWSLAERRRRRSAAARWRSGSTSPIAAPSAPSSTGREPSWAR